MWKIKPWQAIPGSATCPSAFSTKGRVLYPLYESVSSFKSWCVDWALELYFFFHLITFFRSNWHITKIHISTEQLCKFWYFGICFQLWNHYHDSENKYTTAAAHPPPARSLYSALPPTGLPIYCHCILLHFFCNK